MIVVAPMASASVPTITREKVGLRRRARSASRTSRDRFENPMFPSDESEGEFVAPIGSIAIT
jgi:hypothetical protein